MSNLKRIERVGHLSPVEFYWRYVRSPVPVVLADAMADWPAANRWSFEWLSETYGSVVIPVEFGGIGHHVTYRLEQKTLAEYIDAVKAKGSGADPGYLANVDLLPLIPALRGDFSFPKYSFWHSVFGISALGFWIGPDGKYSQLHCDFMHNFHAVVVGRKRFRLYAPRHTPVMKVARKQWQSAFSAREYVDAPEADTKIPVEPDYDDVVGPGEMLFLPYGWWHAVTGVGDFMSLNLFWPTTSMLARLVVKGGPSAFTALAKRRWT